MRAQLSHCDQKVLGALFDAEGSLSASAASNQQDYPFPGIASGELQALQVRERDAIRALNAPFPNISDIKATISSLESIISIQPKYASAYVNRAQARRLLIGDRPPSRSNCNEVSAILSDLNTAISFAAPSSSETLSEPLRRCLAAAYTHRGYLLDQASRIPDVKALPKELRDLSKEELEEGASHSFMMGGRYGNAVAREMAVRTNPYAKMCGAIVREAMRKEIAEAQIHV